MALSLVEPAPVARVSWVEQSLRGAAVLGVVEPEVRGLAAVVGPGDVCFDIGAGRGAYTHALAARVGPSGAVHAFEPRPGRFRLLRAGVRVTGGAVRVHRAAVGAVERNAVELDGERIPVTTVDAMCAARGIGRVRFIRIGTAVADVLAGAAGTVERDRPLLLTRIEDDVVDVLRERYGYRMFAWERDRWIPATEPGTAHPHLFAPDPLRARARRGG